VAAELEGRGLGELAWLGARGAQSARASERYPLFALDGCAEGCSRRWLCARGRPPDRHWVVASIADADAIARQIPG
jgi:uncharacterized metal-binding protein